jgi:hypothetical protein
MNIKDLIMLFGALALFTLLGFQIYYTNQNLYILKALDKDGEVLNTRLMISTCSADQLQSQYSKN